MGLMDDSKPTETPLTRLRDLWSYAFTRYDYDDPYLPDPPVELKEFGSNTVFVMSAGLLFGGLQQWWAERKAPNPVIPSGFSKAEQAKFMGEIKTRQLIRVLNSTLKGGLWCGWLGAVYFGVQGLSLYARQVRDPWNTVMAAWASGSIFGFALGGPGMARRLSSSALAVFIAGLIGYPVGFVENYLDEKFRPEVMQRPITSVKPKEKLEEQLLEGEQRKPYPVRDYDVVSAVIDKLDQSLKESSPK